MSKGDRLHIGAAFYKNWTGPSSVKWLFEFQFVIQFGVEVSEVVYG